MSNSDSTDNQSENKSNWPESVPNREVAQANWEKSRPQQLENYAKVIRVTLQPMPPTFNVMLKGRQENLTRVECLELYRRLLDVLVGHLETPCEVVKRAVSAGFGVPLMKLNSPSRREYIVTARNAFIWLAVKFNVARHEICESVNRHYSTIIYSLKDFKNKLETEPKLRARTDELEKKIRELLQ